MDMVQSFLLWVVDHWVVFTLILLIILKGEQLYTYFLLQPLRGGNGVVQMDEFAKYIMMILLVYMVYKEGESAEQVFPESVFWAMVVGAFLIAGVKEFAVLLQKWTK